MGLLARVTQVMLRARRGAAGCSDPLEGKYYNEVGHYVMELKNGKVTMAPGMEYMNAVYEVRGDSIILNDPGGGGQINLFLRMEDGSLAAGPFLGVLKKK